MGKNGLVELINVALRLLLEVIAAGDVATHAPAYHERNEMLELCWDFLRIYGDKRAVLSVCPETLPFCGSLDVE